MGSPSRSSVSGRGEGEHRDVFAAHPVVDLGEAGLAGDEASIEEQSGKSGHAVRGRAVLVFGCSHVVEAESLGLGVDEALQ